MLGLHRFLLSLLGYKVVRYDDSFILSRSLSTKEFVIWTTVPSLQRYSSFSDVNMTKFNWYILMRRA